MKKLMTLVLVGVFAVSCGNKTTPTAPYVLEVTTFSYKSNVAETTFWDEDAKVESSYTSKQPDFVSRESGFDKNSKQVVVVVRWKSLKDAEASMQKFMGDASVQTYAGMIDGPTMKMTRYEIR